MTLTSDRLAYVMESLADELDAEWHEGERSANVDLDDIIDVLRRVAESMREESPCR